MTDRGDRREDQTEEADRGNDEPEDADRPAGDDAGGTPPPGFIVDDQTAVALRAHYERRRQNAAIHAATAQATAEVQLPGAQVSGEGVVLPPRGPVWATKALSEAVRHLEAVRDFASELAAEETALTKALLEALLINLDEVGDFLEEQLSLPEPERGPLSDSTTLTFRMLEVIARRLMELGAEKHDDLYKFGLAIWELLKDFIAN